MAIGGNFSKPGMGSGASAPLPSGGMQGGSATLQQNIQQRVPNQGQFNGNPRGVYNTNFRGQGFAPSSIQQTNLGRYVPPTMGDGGRFGYNSNQWNNFGGYDYNLPGSYGSPQGGGQFAPMPGQFSQYMDPNMLSGNTFGFGNQLQQMGQQPWVGRGWTQQQTQDMISQWYNDRVANEPSDQRYAREAELQGFFGMGPSMPPGKDGRPLQTGFAPMPGPRAPRDNRAGPMMEDIPAYDRPENRSYNMNALYQMMGGWG